MASTSPPTEPGSPPSAVDVEAGALPGHVARNVEAIATLHAAEEQRAGSHQRAVETLTLMAGRPALLYSVLAAVAAWVLVNAVGPELGLRRFDPPPFPWLQGLVGLASLLVTTVVLITQNRQGRLAERRSHLDLQVNLLAEQKIAKLIALVEELRRDLPSVRDRRDSEAEAMQTAADPGAVLTALDGSLHAAVLEEAAENAEEGRAAGEDPPAPGRGAPTD